MQERKLTVAEVQERLATYHEPYHQELARILAGMRAASGGAIQLSFHCMSAIGAPTHADPGQARADFNIGDIHGTTCTPELFDFIASTLQDRGHSVSRNFPVLRRGADAAPLQPGERLRKRVHRDQQAACSSTQDVQEDRRLPGDQGVGRGADSRGR